MLVLLARGIRMELLWPIFSLDTANAIPFQLGSQVIPSQWLRLFMAGLVLFLKSLHRIRASPATPHAMHIRSMALGRNSM